MKKEEISEIPKKWGKEIIIVNNEYYSAKVLCLDKGTQSSIHMHPKKMETFFCIEGIVRLNIVGRFYMMMPYTRAKTIEPMEYHSFYGITDAKILEVATHDDPKDTIRKTQSRGAGE